MEDMRERIIGLLKEREVLHIRQLVRELESGYSEVKKVLDKMVEEGVLESFSHGGYTFYRLSKVKVEEGGESLPEGLSD